MQKLPCTAAILTLNCAATLERCLDSVKNCTEIILLDGNSTDATHAIAKRYGARIEKQYDTNEPNVRAKDFSQLRRNSYALATYPWVFYIDSDEYVSPELMRGIAQAVNENNPSTAYCFNRIPVIDAAPRHHPFNYPNWVVRLWHKESGVVFKQNKIVHEQIDVPHNVSRAYLPGFVYAAWPDIESYKRKNEFYWSLFEKKNNERKDGARKWREAKSCARNLVRACGILLKIVVNALIYPARERIPFAYSRYFVKHHLAVALLRLRNLI